MSEEKAIRSRIAGWHEATAAGDVERVLALIDEDVVFLGAGRAPGVCRPRAPVRC